MRVTIARGCRTHVMSLMWVEDFRDGLRVY